MNTLLTVGCVADTEHTRHLTPQQRLETQEREARTIFVKEPLFLSGMGRRVAIADEKEFARRLVACWNACQELPTDELEEIAKTGGMLGPREDVARIAAQRDALLYSLEKLATAMTQPVSGCPDAKHTPGPWRAVETRVYFPRLAGGFDIRNCPAAGANARLIAAAPELLEALLKYELPINTENIDLSRIEFGSEAVERELQRRAAIAKATGEEK